MGLLSLIATLGINIKPYQQGLSQAKSSAKSFGSETAGALKNQLAGVFGTAAIVAFGKKTVEIASQIRDVADATGVSTDTLQEWKFAAEQTGSSLDAVAGFFEHLGKARNEALGGNEDQLARFKQFGITLKDLQTLRVQDLGKKISGAVAAGDIQQLGAALQEIGGRGATELAPALQAFKELAEQARTTGQIMDNDMINNLDNFGDELGKATGALRKPMGVLISALNWFLNEWKEIWTMIGVQSTHVKAGDWLPWNWGDLKKHSEEGLAEANAMIKQQKDAEAAAEAKRKNSRFSNEDSTEKRAKEDRLMGLRLKLHEEQEKSGLKAMTAEEQLFALQQKRLHLEMLIAKFKGKMPEEGRLNLGLDLEHVKQEILDMQNKPDSGALKVQADSLQQIGGYLGNAGNQNPVLEVARQQLTVQRAIAEHTDPNKKTQTAWFSNY